MKGYVFNYGVDGFGADIAPAHEVGCYLNFDEALEKCRELNKKAYDGAWSPSVKRHSLDEICLMEEPWLGFYCIEEIEIF